MLLNPTPLCLVKSKPVVFLTCVQSYQMRITCEDTYQQQQGFELFFFLLVCHSFHWLQFDCSITWDEDALDRVTSSSVWMYAIVQPQHFSDCSTVFSSKLSFWMVLFQRSVLMWPSTVWGHGLWIQRHNRTAQVHFNLLILYIFFMARSKKKNVRASSKQFKQKT